MKPDSGASGTGIPDQGEVLDVIGDRIRILAGAESTGGRATILELTTEPGMGPPLHRHGREDEYFFVVEGLVRFVVDGREMTVSAGSFAFAPRGSTHTFRNVGAVQARMLVTCLPAGIEGGFRAAHRLGQENRANPQTLSAAFAAYGVEILGPPLAE